MKYHEKLTDFYDWKDILMVICVVKTTRIGFILQHLNPLNVMGKFSVLNQEASMCFLKIPAVHAE